MNRTTLQIAEFIALKYDSCSLDEAASIQADMDADFSECTARELEAAIMRVLGSRGCWVRAGNGGWTLSTMMPRTSR